MSPQVAFGWPLVSDSVATFSGGSWTGGALTNAQLPALSSVARSANVTLTSTIANADFTSAKYVGVVAAVRHNLQKDALWRIRGGSDSSFATNSYDSGWVAVWPVQWATGVLPTGHPNAATRLLTNAQIAALNPPRDAVHVLTTETSARYWRVEFNDTTNTDGYVQAARLLLAPLFRPTYHFAVGSEFGFEDASTSGRTMSGTRFVDPRPVARSLTMSFPMSPDAEAVSVLRDMQEDLGIDGQLYVIQDTADTVNLQRRSFLATLKQLSPVQYAAAGYSSVPLAVEEVR